MKTFEKIAVKDGARTELHDALHLTGAEISVNALPAGASVPFVHSHKQNEEIYCVLEGCGVIEIDGQKEQISAGEWFRVAPAAKRRIFAGDKGVKYICIQVKQGSLGGYTADDAIIG